MVINHPKNWINNQHQYNQKEQATERQVIGNQLTNAIAVNVGSGPALKNNPNETNYNGTEQSVFHH